MALVATGSVLGQHSTLILGETEHYAHTSESGLFTDTGTFTLLEETLISVSIVDNEADGGILGPILDVSSFEVSTGGTSIAIFDELTSHIFSLGTLGAGEYTLTFDGFSNGLAGSVYDVTVNAVPLPAAVWLFGSALLGFAAFTGRRSV
ncbi:MAG: VPLPA-CTERM sorting domain-containing protein [Candidatus Thiodiazotropha sp.]